MKLIDLFLTSKQSLGANKGRSFLTILGIVIGISAVILMLSIGKSAEGLILNQVADLGSDLVFVEPSSGDAQKGPPDPFIEQTLRLKDAKFINNTGQFNPVVPFLQSTATVGFEQTTKFTQVVGTTEGYIEVFPSEIEIGRFIIPADVNSYARVVVLGKEIANDLFGDQNPLGKKVKVKNTAMRVVGVFPEQGTRFFQNLDQQIAIPVTTAQRDVFGVEHVTYFVNKLKTGGDIDFAKEELKYAMRDAHKINNPEGLAEKDDFFVSSQSDAVEIIGIVGTVLSVLLVSIAAISLVVGGIGIMNIMLVSVTERTKEIGLRKSVGATYKEILLQFLLESVMLTMIGGLMGVLLGVLTAEVSGYIVGKFVDGWEANVPIMGIILGVIVSTAVGVIFGIYPAKRAAKLNPIDALRYE